MQTIVTKSHHGCCLLVEEDIACMLAPSVSLEHTTDGAYTHSPANALRIPYHIIRSTSAKFLASRSSALSPHRIRWRSLLTQATYTRQPLDLQSTNADPLTPTIEPGSVASSTQSTRTTASGGHVSACLSSTFTGSMGSLVQTRHTFLPLRASFVWLTDKCWTTRLSSTYSSAQEGTPAT